MLSRAASLLAAASVAAALAGCATHDADTPSTPLPAPGSPSAPASVAAENQLFLSQKSFDPWLLTTRDPNRSIDIYAPAAGKGRMIGSSGAVVAAITPGRYNAGGAIVVERSASASGAVDGQGYSQTLDMRTGAVSNTPPQEPAEASRWKRFWQTSDIVVAGDPEAQQATHASLFYLAGSAMAGGSNSVPPMGYSSDVYNGHIFWDAEIWMFPALIAQHPELVKGMIDYRFKRLAQARANAAAHGYKGAEFPWESADTGKEMAPAEFSQERHITADVAYAAWQYYLWTGDKSYLAAEGWPILQACAQYWLSRASKGADGKYHILKVIGPDETAGVVDDDAWTNAVVAQTLHDAALAARELDRSADPHWREVASGMALLSDSATGVYRENAAANDRLMAKQADAQMLIYPLGAPMPDKAASATLDYCLKHTIAVGPAMTDSINSVIAARLGRAQQSLDLFHSSYRPFLRGPWDAFSEKRTRDNVYFCTGMGGCLQSVLYGFGGLRVVDGVAGAGSGTLVATAGGASLCCNPHLPPGWTGLTLKGVMFRGRRFDISISAGDKVSASPS